MVIIGHESWMMSHFRSNLTQRSFEVISRLIMNPRSVQLLDDGWFVSFEWPDRLLLLKNHSLLVPIRCVDEAILHNHHPPKNSSIKKSTKNGQIFLEHVTKNLDVKDSRFRKNDRFMRWKRVFWKTKLNFRVVAPDLFGIWNFFFDFDLLTSFLTLNKRVKNFFRFSKIYNNLGIKFEPGDWKIFQSYATIFLQKRPKLTRKYQNGKKACEKMSDCQICQNRVKMTEI